MKNNDFEEINDMLNDVIGGTSNQGLFQFSCDAAANDKESCTTLCHTSCEDGIGTNKGNKFGTIFQDNKDLIP